MKIEKIKPIPKSIIAKIKKQDKQSFYGGIVRYYAYLSKNDGELCKITVAVKNKHNNWYCKQVAVHGIHSEDCFIKDLIFYYNGGYVVGWYEEGLQNYKKHYEGGWGESYDHMFDMYAPIVNLEYLDKFPEYKYSLAKSYPYVELFKYLRVYEKYPEAEYLMKLRLYRLATSVQILKLLKKDKLFRKWIVAHQNEFVKYYDIAVIINAYKKNKSLTDEKAYENKRKEFIRQQNGLHGLNKYVKINYDKLIPYITENKLNLASYADYIRACYHLKLNMKDTKVLYPHDFTYWHDERMAQMAVIEAEIDEKENKKLYEKFALVSNLYSPLELTKKAPFIAFIAKTPYELIQEGKCLSHCVGGSNYREKFLNKETLIFFIRTNEAPTTPFVTLEYSLKRHQVLQCYAYHNEKPQQDVLDFVHKTWLPYANKQLRKIAA